MFRPLILLLFQDPAAFALIFGGIVIAIGIHEASHSYAADRLGDPTPRALGRTTLNPLAHLDPMGTLVLLFTGVFGWGKPAPYDPYNLRNPGRDTALLALAGPASNLALAIGLSLLYRLAAIPSNIAHIIVILVQINIGLALFNLLPIPPLDGSKIFLSHETQARLYRSSNWLLLMAVIPIFNGVSLASLIISPLFNLLFRLLVG